MANNKLYISGRFAFDKDVGKVRLSNEDQVFACVNAYGTVLLVVCDGMGGESKGDLASSLAMSTIRDSFNSINKFRNKLHVLYWVTKAIKEANSIIYDESTKNRLYKGMGTTLSMAVIYHGTLVTAQIGDSRIYQLDLKGNFSQLTEDQTYVDYLYRTGQISKEEMKTHPKRHMLMNALGIYPTANVDIKVHKYLNQRILICSDGLYNNVSDNSIMSVLKSNDSPEQKVHELISLANFNGGSDNIAVAIWESNDYAA